MSDADLSAADAAYEIARIQEPHIRDIEHALGEAIDGHLNARRALKMVYMKGYLDGATNALLVAQEALGGKDGTSD